MSMQDDSGRREQDVRQCVVLSPTAILGYGFPESSFLRGLAYDPDVIAVDAGSTDPGPYYLGVGKSFTDREAVKRDLTYMVRAGVARKIPVIIGTAGGSGAAPHLAWCEEIIREIAEEYDLHLRMAVIASDVAADRVREAWVEGRITSLPYVPAITEEDISASTNIVAQMGVEPLIKALEEGFDVVLAGRCYDPACFAALPILQGYDPGLAVHMGKILECAAIAASPGSGSDCVIALLDETGFELRTLSDERKFTVASTCAHTLYEKSDPYHLHGPGGVLDLEQAVFTETDEGVRVSGSLFRPLRPYTLKLEGARLTGFRTISLGATRDPIMIASIDETLKLVQERVAMLQPEMYARSGITIHRYGKDGVMGALEPEPQQVGHELALLIEVVAPTRREASSLCSLLRSTLLHYGYAGRISTAGNLAFPFSPSDIEVGPVYEFSLYHLMQVSESDATDLFPCREVQL